MDEDLAGTASTVRRWLLIEQPGPWGADALAESRLDPVVAERLAALGRRVGLRVLLIRRHGRASEPAQRSAFTALTSPRRQWLRRVTFTDPAELLELDWEQLEEGEPVGGEPHDEPLFLVCTNGRHDACCAELGRPVASVLSAAEPEATWESSHFGGDRFAGNVVCLPDGIYYGRVTAADAPALAAATRDRQLSLPHLRGLSSQPFSVQAAEIALRRHLGIAGMNALRVSGRQRLADGALRVTFRREGGAEHAVVVTTRRDAPARALSCGGAPAVPPRFETRVETAA